MFLKVNVKNTLNYKKKCIDNNDIFLLLAVKLSRKNDSRHNYNNTTKLGLNSEFRFRLLTRIFMT